MNSGQVLVNIANHLEHNGVVVRDLEKTMGLLMTDFGIGPWNILNIPLPDSELIYRGKPVKFTYRSARPQTKMPGAEIELIQPVDGDNIFTEFLRERGEGVQHVGSYKVPTMEEFSETIRALEKAGFPCVQSMRDKLGGAAYFDTTKVLKSILEISCRPFGRRPPDSVYP